MIFLELKNKYFRTEELHYLTFRYFLINVASNTFYFRIKLLLQYNNNLFQFYLEGGIAFTK